MVSNLLGLSFFGRSLVSVFQMTHIPYNGVENPALVTFYGPCSTDMFGRDLDATLCHCRYLKASGASSETWADTCGVMADARATGARICFVLAGHTKLGHMPQEP